MSIAPEFSRPHRIDRIGAGAASVEIEADAGERAALARRFAIESVDRLVARFALRRDSTGIIAHGSLSADVVQACIATAEPVPATLDEAFTLRFVPEGTVPDAELELTDADCDTIFYTGTAIDLGEAAAETLALALDPFPRSADAETALRALGVIPEEEARPLSAFAALKDRLGG